LLFLTQYELLTCDGKRGKLGWEPREGMVAKSGWTPANYDSGSFFFCRMTSPGSVETLFDSIDRSAYRGCSNEEHATLPKMAAPWLISKTANGWRAVSHGCWRRAKIS